MRLLLATLLSLVAADPMIVELFLGQPARDIVQEQLYGLNALNGVDDYRQEEDFLDQLSAIDPCDPARGHCQVYSLVQLDHNQLAIVNLGRWEDLQKNVQNAVNKVQAGVKHASSVKMQNLAGVTMPKLSQVNEKKELVSLRAVKPSEASL